MQANKGGSQGIAAAALLAETHQVSLGSCCLIPTQPRSMPCVHMVLLSLHTIASDMAASYVNLVLMLSNMLTDVQHEGATFYSRVQASLVPCPHCGRSFSETAAERHIPKCQDTVHKPTRLLAGGGTGAHQRVLRGRG